VYTKLLPILRGADWPAAVLAVSRPLFDDRSAPERSTTIPLVSFAYDTPEATYAVTWDSLTETGRSIDALWLEAVGNLARVAVQWRVVERRADGGPRAIRGYGEYASETILVRSTMLWLQEQLGARGLLVSIPVRGEIFVQDAFAVEPFDDVVPLMKWTRERFVEAEQEGVAPEPLVIHEGEIVGAVRPPEPAAAQSGPWDDLGPPLSASELLALGAPERTLRPAAYLTRERCFEYTCHLAPGAAISRAELEEIHGLVSARRTADGRPVERVRVLFYDEEMARRAGPPLAALGAEICFLHPQTGRPQPLS